MHIAITVLLLVQITTSSILAEDDVDREFTWDDLSNLAKSGIRSAVKIAMPSMYRAMSKANVSSGCERGLLLYLTSLRKLDPWSVRMVDATSKFPSGLLEGTLIDFGSLDECIGIQVKEFSRNSKNKELFRGRYCTLGLHSPLIRSPWAKLPDDRNYTAVYGYPPAWIYEGMVKMARYMENNVVFWFGVCVPSLCTEDDVRSLATVAAGQFGVKIPVSICQVDEPYVWNQSTLAAVCALGCLAGLCVAATLLDVIQRWQKIPSDSSQGAATRAVKAFSVFTNTEKLLCSDGGSGSLECFNGIRFLSSTWIIFGHTYVYIDYWKYIVYRELSRLSEIFDGSLPFTVIENFTLAVSSFFFISGFLLVYTTWKQLDVNGGRINFLMFFIHKYWRMTPGVLLVMALFFSMPLMGSGPLWNLVIDSHIQRCHNLGWANLLYIQNWYSPVETCLNHTWHLAALLQLHIVGIVLLVITYRWTISGIVLAFLSMAACITITALDVVWNNYPMPVFSHAKSLDVMADFIMKIYTRPFLHFPTYLVGMVGAFLVLKFRHKKLSAKYQIFGWIVATILALLSLYGVQANANSIVARAVYISTGRIGWAISLAWMTYACSSGFGGIVNRILSTPVMRPLGQISYLAYLTHYLVLIYRNAAARERIYNGHIELVFSAFSTIVVGFGLAYAGYVTVEMPFATLEKIIFKSPKNKHNTEKHTDKDPTVTTPNGNVTAL